MSHFPIAQGFPPPDICLSNNRLSKEFERDENSILGKGLYATVYEVKHKIDNQKYAVKEILLRGVNSPESCEFEKAMKEVNRLSRFKNDYIVGYKTPWFEQRIPVEKAMDSGKQTVGTVVVHELQSTEVSLTSFSSVVSNIETAQSPDEENIISLIEMESIDNQIFNHESNEYIFDQHKDTFLYIQMELCNMTLNDWILLRNFQISGVSSRVSKTNIRNMRNKNIMAIIKNEWIIPELGNERILERDQFHKYIQHSPTNRLLEGIVKGLRYLHGEKVAHKDLHLNNVLIKVSDHGEITPRISDFSDALTIDKAIYNLQGNNLQSTRQQNCENISQEARENDNNSPRTHTCSSLYECKEDMEKLGIIIQELFGHTKNNHDDFESRWPIHAGWIKELEKSFWERPTATKILREGIEAGIFESKDQKELEQLRREEKLENEINELRRQLGESETRSQNPELGFQLLHIKTRIK